MKTARVVGGIAAISVVLLWLTASPATAADVESISSYDTVMQIAPDGTMHVTETIAYDFGGNHKHGIFRFIPVRFHYDDYRDRVYRMNDITVTRDGRAE